MRKLDLHTRNIEIAHLTDIIFQCRSVALMKQYLVIAAGFVCSLGLSVGTVSAKGKGKDDKKGKKEHKHDKDHKHDHPGKHKGHDKDHPGKHKGHDKDHKHDKDWDDRKKDLEKDLQKDLEDGIRKEIRKKL